MTTEEWNDKPTGAAMTPKPDTSPENVAREYLICKHGLYYAPNSRGYTGIRDLAGRYTLEEARRSSHPNGSDGPRDGMDYLHESEAPEFSPKCFDDLKVKHLLKQRAALAAERDALAADVTTYQGIVRDMTAENGALAARVAELEAELSHNDACWAAVQAAEAKLAASEVQNKRLRVRLDRGMKWCDMMDGPVSRSQFVNGQATAAQQIRAALEGAKP